MGVPDLVINCPNPASAQNNKTNAGLPLCPLLAERTCNVTMTTSATLGMRRPMPYLRTEMATDFSEPSSWWQRLLAVDTANPGYRGQYHRVKSWLIEFDDDGNPWREIGLDAQGAVVIAGPSKRDYGFWLDTNMRYADFAGEPVTQEYFERMWVASGVIAP